jgi:hypothetical protein
MVKVTCLDGNITLDNGSYRATVVPQAGGKVKSFYSVKSGREFLYQDEREVIPEEGYEAFDHSGWDECFPNIRPCAYPAEPFQGVELPDHGFSWSQPNSWQPVEGGVMLIAEFPGFRLKLTRLYMLNDNGLTVQYRLSNEGSSPFVYLTDAHILFSWEPGLRVELPPEAESLYVYRSSDADIVTPGTWVPPQFWNEAAEGYNCKVFTPQLSKGEIVLHYGQTASLRTKQENMEESVHIIFDPAELPYAGLWVAKEFRDALGNRTHCFSVQPTNLASATLPPLEWAGNCRTVLPGQTKVLDVTLAVS